MADVNNLALQKSYGGRIVTSCSPSSPTVTLLWPDGHQQTVRITDNPTVAVRDLRFPNPDHNGRAECHIYIRGSQPYQDIINLLQESDSELNEARRELEADFAKRIAELEARKLNNLKKIEGKPQVGLPTCNYEAPHFDCDVCPDPATNHSPRHFDIPAAFSGHLRGAEHARLAAKKPVGATA